MCYVGDVFGVYNEVDMPEGQVDKEYRWGAMTAVDDKDDDEDEEDDEEEEGYGDETDNTGVETPMTLEGISSVATGLETPDTIIDLRKRMGGSETPDSLAPPRELYQVIKEQAAQTAGQLFASDKTYVLPNGEVGSQLPRGLGEEDADDEVGNKRKQKDSKPTVATTGNKKHKEFKF
jgi:hypothetical protein